MAEETRTQEEILASWNTPPKNSGFDLVVGVPVPEGDTRATASVDHAALGPDAGDYDRIDGDYDDYTVDHLKAEIAARNADREDDDLIEPDSKKKADLVSALEDDDEE